MYFFLSHYKAKTYKGEKKTKNPHAGYLKMAVFGLCQRLISALFRASPPLNPWPERLEPQGSRYQTDTPGMPWKRVHELYRTWLTPSEPVEARGASTDACNLKVLVRLSKSFPASKWQQIEMKNTSLNSGKQVSRNII